MNAYVIYATIVNCFSHILIGHAMLALLVTSKFLIRFSFLLQAHFRLEIILSGNLKGSSLSPWSDVDYFVPVSGSYLQYLLY